MQTKTTKFNNGWTVVFSKHFNWYAVDLRDAKGNQINVHRDYNYKKSLEFRREYIAIAKVAPMRR